MNVKRQLKLWDVFAISSGAMISSGIFVLPGLAFSKSGPAMILAYVLAAILIIPTMLAKSELSTAMPKSGGTYFFIDRSLGPILGVFGGFANWFSVSFKSAFALIGLGSFAILLYPDITIVQIKIIAVIVCILFTFLNIFSVKMTGKIQIFMVILLFVILVLYISRGFISTHPEYYRPFFSQGVLSIIGTTGLVFVSFGGLTKIASVAEEIQNPGKNIPLGMFLSFFLVSLLYILAVSVTIGIVPAELLKGSLIPLSLGAELEAGKIGMIILSLAAITAFITTANAGILSASRTPLAMAKDQLIPKLFSHTHQKYKTPIASILLTSLFMILVIVFLNVENLVKTASTLMILLFIFDNVALIVMRESKLQNYRPQFNIPLYPILPIVAIVSYVFILAFMGAVPLLISLAFFILALIVYFIYAKKRINRTSALMHIIKRISAKELQTQTLEDELREILIHRDEIIEDRFDKLIRECIILDVEGSTSIDKLLEVISEKFEHQCNVDKHLLIEGFMQREAQSSTVLKPGLAIPHIVIPGKKCFQIIPVRSLQGIHFHGEKDPVHTMFVLVGTLDERSYHLRALMAIANLVQESGFTERWMHARNIEELRNVILLSNRKRES